MKENTFAPLANDRLKFSEEDAWRILLPLRFPEGLQCIFCGNDHVYDLKNEQWKCANCKRRFRVFTDTFLEKTKINPAELIEIVDGFIKPEFGEDWKVYSPKTRKTVYKCFKMIRMAIIDKLPSEEKEEVLNDRAKVFGVLETPEFLKIVPLESLTLREIKKLHKKGALGEFGHFKGVITKQETYFFYDPSLKVLEDAGTKHSFLVDYENEYADKVSTQKSKNFTLLLKGLEFLYNLKLQGRLNLQEEILKLLLSKPAESYEAQNLARY